MNLLVDPRNFTGRILCLSTTLSGVFGPEARVCTSLYAKSKSLALTLAVELPGGTAEGFDAGGGFLDCCSPAKVLLILLQTGNCRSAFIL